MAGGGVCGEGRRGGALSRGRRGQAGETGLTEPAGRPLFDHARRSGGWDWMKRRWGGGERKMNRLTAA